MAQYPFSPALLDALPEELAELFQALELTLLEDICSRLNLSDKLNEATVQAIKALRSHGIDMADIEKAIQQTANISEKKLKTLLQDVVDRNRSYYTELVDLAKVTVPDTMVDQAAIDAITDQAFADFRNITRSLGFLVDAGRTKLAPAKAYQWALDNAALQIQSGAVSYNQAIRASVRQLAQSGLKTVMYESGHTDQIDVAARRAVMTGVNQICNQYSDQAAEYLDTSYFEVTAHSGARDKPGPSPWSSHKDWQGQVYYQSEHGEADPLGEYEDLVKTTGYGYVDGLLGANCRHHKHVFIPGVMERTYTDKQLRHIDDGLGCTFDGKKYTAYEATQMQRSIERSIRKLKREKAAYKAAGLHDDEQAVDIRLRRLNAKYKEFSKAAGLPEQRERTRVDYGNELTNIKRFAPLKGYSGTWEITSKFSERQYVIKMDAPMISRPTQHFLDNLETRGDRSQLTLEAAQNIINRSKMILYQTDKQTFKFISDDGYAILGTERQLVTAVPEKLRKKYRDYLEGLENGKKP